MIPVLLANLRGAPQAAATAQDNGWSYYSTSTTPEWEGQIKSLREAVERLSHQTDDRFSSLMKPPQRSAGQKERTEGHACRSPPCSRDQSSCRVNGNCCSDLMFEMLVDFSNFLTRLNVTFMVSEGTLLGAVRDEDIIPYTADLDIFVPREGWERAMLINEEQMGPKSYHFMVDPDQPHCARLCAVWEGYPVNRAPFNEHFEWDTEKVGNDLAYYMDIYDEDMDFAIATKHLIYPPSAVKIRNHTFPAPREKEIYVEARYGPSWRIPDHQARELAEKYPTLEEARVWSQNMLMLREARQNLHAGFRLLERASVSFKTGDIQIRADQDPPHYSAKAMVLEGFGMSADRKVTAGRVTIFPPELEEEQIVEYVMYWAKQEISWSDELVIQRVDSGFSSEDDAVTESSTTNEALWYTPEVIRPVVKIWRCKMAANPFKACSVRGMPLQVAIPTGIPVPETATHLGVTAANEAGENTRLTAVRLFGEEEQDGFSSKILLGVLQGFSTMNRAECGAGQHSLALDGWKNAMDSMMKRNDASMKEALSLLSDWLEPVALTLQDCGASTSHRQFAAALLRLRNGVMFYQPGQVLSIDKVSIFHWVHTAIASFRREEFGLFGRDVGNLVRQLVPLSPVQEQADASKLDSHAPEATADAEVESVSSSSSGQGLKVARAE